MLQRLTLQQLHAFERVATLGGFRVAAEHLVLFQASGSMAASRIRCSGDGGRGRSMMSSLSATRVPSASTRTAADGGRWWNDNAKTARA